jgi:hypothetical protein
VNRAERRRNERLARRRSDIVFKRIEHLIRTDGDHCSLCRARFRHNRRSYGGITNDGIIALVSECCASKLEIVFTSGLYTSRRYDEQLPTAPYRDLSAEEAEEAISAHQQRFAAIDKVTDAIARRAGVPAEKMMLHFDDDATSWKADDRKWFKRNPTRSHRLRRLFPSEQISNACNEAVPPGHELQVLVRQISPGLRVRYGFSRNLEIDIPDVEAILHALFDLMMCDRGGRVSVHEVGELARKYASVGALS